MISIESKQIIIPGDEHKTNTNHPRVNFLSSNQFELPRFYQQINTFASVLIDTFAGFAFLYVII